jgi:lipopolysaccharide export LptBFGC system permease protein LptF
MKGQSFINALMPIWIIQIVLDTVQQSIGTDEITFYTNFMLILSNLVLPIVAGACVVRRGGSIGMAIAGALSISLVSIFIVAIGFTLKSAGIEAIAGYIIATIMFAVVPQIVFGVIGGYLGKKLYAKST